MAQKQQNSNSKGGSRPTTLKKREEKFFQSDAKGKALLYRRKLTVIVGYFGATGAAFVQASASSGVTATTEWANLSANFEQYRVRAIKMTVVPRVFSNMNSAAQVWYPGAVVVGEYSVGSGGATTLAILAEGGSEVYRGWDMIKKMVTWDTNPSAKLWTNCNVAIPAIQQIGIQFQGTMPIPATYNGIVTHDIVLEYDTEFLGRN
jgi:hypothetical protein